MSIVSKLLLPALGLSPLCSCSTQYNIDGNSTISGLDGQKLYLRTTAPNGMQQPVPLDSCEVVHGCFQFGGAVDSVLMAELCMGDEPMMPVVIENGTMFVQMDNMMQSVSGGPLNDRLNKFLVQHGRCERQLWDLNRRARNMIYEGKTIDQIVAVIDPLKSTLLTQMRGLEVKFIKENYNNVLGPGYFIRMCNNMGLPTANDDILDILVDAPADFLNNPFISGYVLMMGITPDVLQNERAKRGQADKGRKKRSRKVELSEK